MTSKQDVKTSLVTRSESLVLMKNMIRISVSSICYMRDLFPEYCYKNKEYGSVGIHQLQAAKKDENGEISIINAEAFLLTQWLEKGVFTALESEYLNSMTFAIFSKHPLTHEDLLLETYEFKVSYQADTPAKINNVALLSRETVKNQAAKFIRALTEFSGTLESLPEERWITLQLKYQENTPADYEPEYFKSSDGQLLGSEMLPLKINVGNLKTPTVDMKVKFAGLESFLFEDLCKIGSRDQTAHVSECGPALFNGATHDTVMTTVEDEGEEEDTQLPAKDKRKAAAKESDLVEDMNSMNVDADERITTDEAAKRIVGDEHSAFNRVSRPSSPAEVSQEDKDFDAVKNHVLTKGVASIRACADALGIKESDCKKAFTRMAKDGLITQKKKGGRYEVPTESQLSVPVAEVGKTSSAFYREMEDTAASTAAEEDIEDSCDVVEETGSAAIASRFKQQTLQIEQSSGQTSQAASSMKTKRKMAVESPEETAMSMLSQTSEMSDSGRSSKRARKCSVIKDPINLTHVHAALQQ